MLLTSKNMQKIILFLAIVGFGSFAYGQGCSDAGFCTLGSLKSNFDYEKKDSNTINEKEIKKLHVKHGEKKTQYGRDLAS